MTKGSLVVGIGAGRASLRGDLDANGGTLDLDGSLALDEDSAVAEPSTMTLRMGGRTRDGGHEPAPVPSCTPPSRASNGCPASSSPG